MLFVLPELPAPALRRMMAVLERLYGEPVDVDGYVRLSCDVLKALCEAETVSFSERDWARMSNGSPLNGIRSIWSEPLSSYDALMQNIASVCEAGPAWTCDPEGGVLQLSAFYSQPRLRDLAVYQEGLRYLGVAYNINFSFRVHGRIDLQFGVCRGPSRDFNTVERALAAAIIPHLRRAYEAAVLRTWRRCDASMIARHADIRLTERQRNVLRWLLAGKSNATIGEILGLSGETVKIHVRHIFRAMDVTSRVGAALKLMDAAPGYLPASGAAEIGWKAAAAA